MYRPNNEGILRRLQSHDIYGNEVYGPGARTPCAVVTLIASTEQTNVRTDSSASGSSAQESLHTAKILFGASVKPLRDDRFEIQGMLLRISAVHPRFSVLGHLDHYECDLVRSVAEAAS